MPDMPGICRSEITASIRCVSRVRSASSPLAAVSQGRPSCAKIAAITFRTEASSSTINTRSMTGRANGTESVGKCHPAFSASYERFEIGALLFGRACPACRCLGQVSSIICQRLIQKGVLLHGRDHLAQNLVARKSSKLNRLVADIRNLKIQCGKIVSVKDSVPQW